MSKVNIAQRQSSLYFFISSTYPVRFVTSIYSEIMGEGTNVDLSDLASTILLYRVRSFNEPFVCILLPDQQLKFIMGEGGRNYDANIQLTCFFMRTSIVEVQAGCS